MWQLTSAMKLRVLVEELGSVAALIAIPSGVSSLAFAFDISERTAVSLSWIWAVSRMFDFALIKDDIIFLLIISLIRWELAYQSSASVIEKLLGRSISWPYRLKYFAQVAWNVPIISFLLIKDRRESCTKYQSISILLPQQNP
jgi:hypothetical protein